MWCLIECGFDMGIGCLAVYGGVCVGGGDHQTVVALFGSLQCMLAHVQWQGGLAGQQTHHRPPLK